MADRSRRFALGAIALSFFFLVMSGSARAAIITVNSLAAGSVAGKCTLQDAVTSANSQAVAPGSDCTAGSGDNDTIVFSVTGTIPVDTTLDITDPTLEIEGPTTSPGIFLLVDLTEAFDVDNTTFILNNVTIMNGDTDFGGAIFAEGDDLQVNNCLFTDNIADLGGAIFTDGGTAEITNSTFVSNTAEVAGGAIYTDSDTVYLTNDTFSGNDAPAGEGGSLFATSAIDFKASIFKSGVSGGNCAADSLTDLNDESFNIVTDTTCNLTSAHSQVNLFPGLDGAGLMANGGPTNTVSLVLSPKSPAIAYDTNCTDQFGHPLLTDQRLFTRPNSPTFCDSGAYESDGVPGAAFGIVAGTERMQVARGTAADSDEINLALTFFENGAPTCGPEEDALNSGFGVEVFPGTCADFVAGTEVLEALMTFATHTVNHHSYGTFAQSSPYPVSSKLVVVKPSSGDFCGEWNLTLESSGLDTSSLGAGPIALVLLQPDLAASCFDITNAIIGSQIPPPLVPVVRRGVRRGR